MTKKWQILNQFVQINSPWLTLIGEKILDNEGKILDYWRVEKDDSVIIITRQNNQLLLPVLQFRAGIEKITLDFAGGRVKKSQKPQEAALIILEKELGIKELDIESLTSINDIGWEINSSFSNQKLFGFVAEIKPNIVINSELISDIYTFSEEGINKLLKELTCLQCRGLLLEWLRKK